MAERPPREAICARCKERLVSRGYEQSSEIAMASATDVCVDCGQPVDTGGTWRETREYERWQITQRAERIWVGGEPGGGEEGWWVDVKAHQTPGDVEYVRADIYQSLMDIWLGVEPSESKVAEYLRQGKKPTE